jgi:hypothetical protein
LQRLPPLPNPIFVETNYSTTKIKVMNKLLLAFSLLIGMQSISFSQKNYSKWNGKTWEQLDGNSKMVQLNPALTPFSIVEVNNINVKIMVVALDGPYTMSVAIDGNLKDFFRFKQVGDSLKLTMDYSGGKYPRWLCTGNIVISIKVPKLAMLVNKGNSKAEVNLQDQSSFNVTADGNPNITLTGKVGVLDLQLSGNVDIKAGKLLAEKIQLDAKGNSNIEVNAKEVVEISMEGNNEISNLFYTSKKEVAAEETSIHKNEMVSFKLKNNSLLPASVTLISYRPDEKGNGTMGFTVLSLGSKKFKFPVGSKIYLADSEQVNTVMSGKTITDQTPFLLVKKEDDGKSFNIK